MHGGRPARRSPARYLAPLALAASVAATILVVEHGVAGHPATQVTSVRSAPRRSPTTRARPGPRFYTVRQGDTLSGISAKTGVSMSTLQSLNPSVSPNSLQPGQRLRLRR
jgi:LysM repeat protein